MNYYHRIFDFCCDGTFFSYKLFPLFTDCNIYLTVVTLLPALLNLNYFLLPTTLALFSLDTPEIGTKILL